MERILPGRGCKINSVNFCLLEKILISLPYPPLSNPKNGPSFSKNGIFIAKNWNPNTNKHCSSKKCFVEKDNFLNAAAPFTYVWRRQNMNTIHFALNP